MRRRVEIKISEARSYRRAAIYFCLIIATATFIILYSSSLNLQAARILPRIRTPNTHAPQEEEHEQSTERGFLVYSEKCKIPDLNPFHPSIRHLIDYSPPLNCSEYEPLTLTEGNLLIVNAAIAESRGIKNYSCCYKVIYRDRDGMSDNAYRFSDRCKEMKKKTSISDEFIMVECSFHNGTVFYKDFHSFIHDKQEVEKRCENSTARYSFLIIGVDAISRLNMHRQLNKTSRYLLEEMGAMEMYGFNKVGDNTFPNLIPLLLGYDERELPNVCWNSTAYHLDSCNFMWNHFKQKGYRTLYAEDTPYISSFNYRKLGFAHQPTDYYFRNFILAYEDALGREKPLNCHLCVGSISETEAVLQWTEKFVTHFKSRPYFAFAWINSLTHDYLNMGSAGDHMYEQFFHNLHISGAFNNTIIVFMGDHGMRWGKIRTTYVGRLEERLPMLLFVLPENFQREFPELALNLKRNRHRLVTPFDLHATLDNILHIDEGWTRIDTINVAATLQEAVANRSLSLLKPIPKDRSCDDAYIDEHWCTCQMSLEANPNSTDVMFIALFFLNEMNAALRTRASVCAALHLESIEQARLWHPSNQDDHSQTNTYTVVIKTLPGHGLFEGTARFHRQNGHPELLGTISRLNLYGNQSLCVDDAILQKYCYCV